MSETEACCDSTTGSLSLNVNLSSDSLRGDLVTNFHRHIKVTVKDKKVGYQNICEPDDGVLYGPHN